jgi:cytochrome c peroxidase
MKKYKIFGLIVLIMFMLSAMNTSEKVAPYLDYYNSQVNNFDEEQQQLIGYIQQLPVISSNEINSIKEKIWDARLKMKSLDFWFRYLEPVAYMKINGPLPVEWENEVFEKYEKPYKRIGAGLSLAELYIDEPGAKKDSLISLLQQSQNALATFRADSITVFLQKPDHFFFANRLFLLNLAAIYTTGFECPDTSRVIPELSSMLNAVQELYNEFNTNFPSDTLYQNYLSLYASMKQFVNTQGQTPSTFDHYHFIRDYVNPLFAINQQFIHQYHAISKNFNDYSLNNNCFSIFDKSLYRGQMKKEFLLQLMILQH